MAAVIVEPLVQCAGGMRMYDPLYLKLLREACDKYGVHLIADEIAVGFGRTGTMFACEQAGIRPDYLCLSKGLTGGYLPLSVGAHHRRDLRRVLRRVHASSTRFCIPTATPAIRWPAPPPTPRSRSFATSRCSNAIAPPRARMLASVEHLRDHPHVAEIRQCGMILAIELMKDPVTRTPWPWQERRGLRIYQHALERGALIRPLGTTIYFMPPYVIAPDGDRTAGAHRHRRHRARMRLTRIYRGRSAHRQGRRSSCPSRRANT